MAGTTLADDQRGVTVSDGMAVGAMIVLTLALAGGLGVSVLVGTDDGGPPSANFSYQYFESGQTLVVTHERGDPLTAGQVVLSDGEVEKTWAEIAVMNASGQVTQGSTIQLSNRGRFGDHVDADETVTITWTNEGGNETVQLDQWQGSG